MADFRLARASALMAGNGAVLLKLWDVFMADTSKDGFAQADAPIIALLGGLSLAGIGAAYATLLALDAKSVRLLEICSAVAFLCPLVMFGAIALWPGSN